jgi:hypothetical protein
MTLNNIFNKGGNFIDQSYDPYRWQESHRDVHTFLFDEEDGSMNEKLWCDGSIGEFITQNRCGPFSDIVKLYWAQEMGTNTKGSYPAIYMWR